MFKGPWPRWPQFYDEPKISDRIRRIGATGLWTLRANPKVSLAREAEEEIAHLTGRRHAVLVSSGTTAVELAALAVGACPGRDVVVPALGWHATAAAVRRTGARVVFADVEPQTSCIDPKSVEAVLTPDTIAIVAVHLHCAVADLTALRQLAEAHGLALIEDAAQAHGAALLGRPVGSHGTLGCFSYNQEKLIPAGEGGAVVVDDSGLFERIYALRTDGYRELADGTLVPNRRTGGHNAAMSEFQAVVLLDQIEAFESRHRLRAETARELHSRLAEIRGVATLATTPGTTQRAFYEMGLIFEPVILERRSLDDIAAAVSEATGVHLHRTDKPVMQSALYNPPGMASEPAPLNARQLYDSMLVFHHRYLLEPRLAEVLPDTLLSATMSRS